MGTFSHTSTYTHPVETVTAWHMRKGALTRATPPVVRLRRIRQRR